MRELRKQALLSRLKAIKVEIEVILNQLEALHLKYPDVPKKIIYHEKMTSYCDLEIAMTMACLVIRKLSENNAIEIDEARREDINAMIHSTYFHYEDEERMIKIKSRKGPEVVYLDDILGIIEVVLKYYHLS